MEIDSGRKTHYHLKCRLSVFNKGYRAKSGKVYQMPMIYLVPESSTECVKFFNAWLPDPHCKPNEVVGIIPHPIHSHVSLAVKRANDDLAEHHLVVLSIAAETELLEFAKTGRDLTLQLEVLPADDWEKQFNAKF